MNFLSNEYLDSIPKYLALIIVFCIAIVEGIIVSIILLALIFYPIQTIIGYSVIAGIALSFYTIRTQQTNKITQ